MIDQARLVGKPTFSQAVQFSHKCEALAGEAAIARTRDEMGAKFEAKATETAKRLRKNREMIVKGHVCAIASDRPSEHCTPIM